MMNSNNNDRKYDTSSTVPADPKQDQTRDIAEIAKSPLLFSKRSLVIMLLFIWNIVLWHVRNNMNVAVIDMSYDKKVTRGNLTIMEEPEFRWSSRTIGTVISLLAYGSLATFISGFVISKLGGSLCCALSMLTCGITTLLTPVSLRCNFYLFLVCRLMTGIFFGFYVPSFSEIFSHWIPQRERVKLMTLCYGGVLIGAAIVYPICGLLAFKWGWPMIFYTTGSTCIAMAIICLFVLKNTPSEDNSISKKELLYILDGMETNTSAKKVSYPLKHILTSSAIWALNVANLAHACTITFLFDYLPLYIKDITGRNIADVGIISSIPTFVNIIMFLAVGVIIQYWKANSNITTTRMHKILMSVGFIGQMFMFSSLTIVSNFKTIMLIMVLIRTFTPINILILQLIVIDLAPGHSGTIASISNFSGAISTILTQTAISFMTTNHTMEEWNHCFILISSVLAFSTIIFAIFGSSKPQPWCLSSNFEEKCNSSTITVMTITK